MFRNMHSVSFAVCCLIISTDAAFVGKRDKILVVQRNDGSEEYTISVTTPNLTLVNDDLYMCVSVDLPPGTGTSYIVEITPNPIVGMYYHILAMACDGPGYRDPNSGHQSVWDCGTNETYERFTGLPRAEQCGSPDSPHGSFKYQFQGGSSEEAALRLPEGTGIPVGGKTGTDSLVFGFHFPQLSRTIDGTTGKTRVDVKLVRNQPKIKPTSSILLGGFGFLGAKSVSTVSASWILDQDIPVHPTVVYTHSHNLAIGMKVFIERKDGKMDLIHEKDPRIHKGMMDIKPEPQPMRLGDKLQVECEYNNTLSTNVRVWNTEMCYVILFYYVDGGKTLDLQLMYSVDPVYKDCFPSVDGMQSHSANEQANYEGKNSFQNATREDCSAPLVLHG